MRILVTGGLGFIGTNYVIGMIKKGVAPEKITVLDALKFGSNKNNLSGKNCDIIIGDISNVKLMKKIIPDFDIIINFAAETHVDRSIANPQPFIESNILGTFGILEAMRESKSDATLVHISTDEVYGDIEKGSFTEESRLRPSSPYSATKASSDMLVMSYARTYNINAMITRCTNNYGPYQFPEKLIPKTIIRASKGNKIPIYGKGTNIRDWIFVEDHCNAIDAVLEKGERGEIYNISSGIEKTNLEIVKEILKLMNKSQDIIEFVQDRPGHDIRYSLDSTKIRNLGWKPKYSIKEGLEETVGWYLQNEDWWKPLATENVLGMTPWKNH